MNTMEREVNVVDPERYASLIFGTLLLAKGLRSSATSVLLGIAGGFMICRGLTGHCGLYKALGIEQSQTEPGWRRVTRSTIVNRPVEDVYGFWRHFENLPRFMSHLQAVHVTGDKTSHWVASAPGGATVEWDAEITEDRPNESISWQTLPGAEIENRGTVRFMPTIYGCCSRVRVDLEYKPPMGDAGVAIARFFGEEPSQQIRDDLRRLKNVLEEGLTQPHTHAA